MKKFNMDHKTRDKILLPYRKNNEGVIRFSGLPFQVLKELFDKNYVDPDDFQSDIGPTNKDFLDFLQANPRFTCQGYAIPADRHDYRIIVEGVTLTGEYTKEELITFVEKFRQADYMVLGEKSLTCDYY